MTQLAEARATTRTSLTSVFFVLTTLTFLLSRRFDWFGGRFPFHEHLGGEYWCIAQAMAAGRGYSDPFCSGAASASPTSWMPPLFTCLLALLQLLLQSQALVALVVVAFSNLALALVGTLLFHVSNVRLRRLSPWWAVVAYAGWLIIFYPAFFMLSHDVWLIALVTSVIVALMLGSHELDRPGWRWGIAGGFAALSSPSLGTAWAVVTLRGLWLARGDSGRAKRWVRALLIAGTLSSPWVVRNALAFHAFIPTKSNLMFDAHQANTIDDDGVYGEVDFTLHPFNSAKGRDEYSRLGEKAFISRYKEAFFESVRARPLRFFRRVAARATAITLSYPPASEHERSERWIWLRRALHPLPFVALLWLGWRAGKDSDRIVITNALIFYAVYVVPYVLFAFHQRHLMPLTPLLLAFVLLAADRLLERISGREPASPASSTAVTQLEDGVP